MGFCQCGGIISPKGKCVECGRSDAVVQTEIAKTESTFTREGPLVVEKPANVVILEGGRTKNTYKNGPSRGSASGPKLHCGDIQSGSFCAKCGEIV